jgi:hypothetical protein
MKESAAAATEWAVIYDGSTRPEATRLKFQDGSELTAGTTYSFRTVSRNAKGASPPSDAIDITAANIPAQMAAPTRVSVSIDAGTAATSVAIAWTALALADTGGSPVTGYRIRRNSGYGTSLQEAYVAVADPATLTHTFDSELLLGVTYRIVVAAVNAVHTSNAFDEDGSGSLVYSEALEITVANLPAAVADLAQSPADYEKGTIHLVWSEPSSFSAIGGRITSYVVYKDVGSGMFYPLTEVSGSTTEFRDTGLVVGQAYSYKVAATNVIGTGPASGPLTGKAGQEPSQVQGLRITGEAASALSFEWDSSLIDDGGLPISKYVVSMDEGDLVYDASADVAAPATSYTHAVTQPGNEGKTFRFRVAAVNEFGTGPMSAETRLVATDPPGTPTLSLLETTRTLDGFELAFGSPASAGGAPLIGFLLYRDQGVAGSPETLAFNGSSKPEVKRHFVGGLETGLTYHFTLYALNKIFASATAATLSPLVGTLPGRPLLLRRAVEAYTAGVLPLEWDAPSDTGGLELVRYEIFRDDGAGDFGASPSPALSPAASGGTGASLAALAAGTTYGLKVRAVNAVGHGDFGDTVYLVCADRPAAPPAPAVEASTRSSVTLAWAEPGSD